MNEKIHRILEKLGILAKDYETRPGRRFVKFGVEMNPYQLNPCLSEREIDAMEEQYGIRLPPEFRAFVTQVGNGGGKFFEPLETLIVRTLESNKNNPKHFELPFLPEDFTAGGFVSGFLTLIEAWPAEVWLILNGEKTGSIYYAHEELQFVSDSFLDYFGKELEKELQ